MNKYKNNPINSNITLLRSKSSNNSVFTLFHRIQNDERGLLFKKGNYEKVLKPGSYFFFPFTGKKIIKMDLNQNFVTSKNINIFLNDKELLTELVIHDIYDFEIGLHYEDGHFIEILLPGRYAFWNVLKKHEIKKIDTRIPEKDNNVDKSVFENPVLVGRFQLFEIASYEKGLLVFDGVFQRMLGGGKYYFWKGPINVTVQKVDMRQQQLDILGQDIMTEDKISLRINFICHYRITDPVKAMFDIKSYQEQLYVLLQLILREYIGTLKLEEILTKKEEIGNYVLAKLRENVQKFGLEIAFCGLKDIILPGEMKTILNQVIEAEKKAQANIITRREETASTRSLLNTVKLMENNPILLRLKELEYIERICDKIDRLTLIGSNNLLEQLSKVFINKDN